MVLYLCKNHGQQDAVLKQKNIEFFKSELKEHFALAGLLKESSKKQVIIRSLDCLDGYKDYLIKKINPILLEENSYYQSLDLDNASVWKLNKQFAHFKTVYTSKTEGWGIGNIPFGFKVKKNKLVKAKNYKIISLIKKLSRGYMQGLIEISPCMIARALNKKGYRTARGKEWTDSAVKYILKNPIYEKEKS